MDEQEVPIEIKRKIVEEELALYRNTRFRTELRHNVLKRVGAQEAELKPLVDDLIRLEHILIELDKERAALNGTQP